jgi:hypothetical protein
MITRVPIHWTWLPSFTTQVLLVIQLVYFDFEWINNRFDVGVAASDTDVALRTSRRTYQQVDFSQKFNVISDIDRAGLRKVLVSILCEAKYV